MAYEESIYHLVADPPAPIYKPPRHKSCHHPCVKPTASTVNCHTTTAVVRNVGGNTNCIGPFPQKGKTFGPANGQSANDPANYLTKCPTKQIATCKDLKKTNPEVFCVSQDRKKKPFKPTLPARDDVPLMNLSTQKNFIVSNAVENILAQPKKPADGPIDWLRITNYGKVPAYLPKLKDQIANEQEMIMEYLSARHQMEHPAAMEPMPEDKRLEIVSALKKKWEDVNQKYQTHTHLTTFSRGQLDAKEANEKQMTALEKKIEVLSKPNVCIALDF